MTRAIPSLTQFRLESQDNGLVHLVFDCPERTMNVFSNKAIHELREVAEWLHLADVRGLLVRSGKETGFCAGADLTELGVAYEMIAAASPADRFDIAFDHFFPLSHAIRRLETAGKPIAAAIAGVALGGGCELSLGCHYRVLTDTPRTMLGLPECQVGLLPGAGGTQRMPRLIGIEAGLQVLLRAKTYSGREAIEAGAAHQLVEPGQEIAAAAAWLLSDAAHAVQPWDQPGVQPLAHSAIAETIEGHRARELSRMLGHEPAPIAILDCVEVGMIQPIDGGIRSEMSVFANLIIRPEPRNMIRTMFLGKQAYDKSARTDTVPDAVKEAAEEVAAAVTTALARQPELRHALFGVKVGEGEPVQQRVGPSIWLQSQPHLLEALADLRALSERLAARLAGPDLLQLDHLVARQGIIPAYLGGVHGMATIEAVNFVKGAIGVQ